MPLEGGGAFRTRERCTANKQADNFQSQELRANNYFVKKKHATYSLEKWNAATYSRYCCYLLSLVAQLVHTLLFLELRRKLFIFNVYLHLGDVEKLIYAPRALNFGEEFAQCAAFSIFATQFYYPGGTSRPNEHTPVTAKSSS